VLNEFSKGCVKQFVDEIGIDDLKAYVDQMRKTGLADPMVGSHACTMEPFPPLHQYLTIYISIRSQT
jgi:hypothetical protein